MKKKVLIREEQNKVHLMYTWTFAYNSARKSDWMLVALDRVRFRNRIDNIGNVLSKVLDLNHRQYIFDTFIACKRN